MGWFSSTFSKIGHAVSSGFNSVKHSVGHAISNISHGAHKIAHSVGKTAGNVWHKAQPFLQQAGKVAGSIASTVGKDAQSAFELGEKIIDRQTGAISNLLNSPFLLPVAGIAGVGAILLLTRA